MTTEIRPARRTDIPDIVRLGFDLWASSPAYRGIPYETPTLTRSLEWLIEGGGVFLADRDGEVVGYILGFLVPFFFSSAVESGEMSVYVAPEARSMRVFRRLVKAYEDWASAAGARRIGVGVTCGLAGDAAVVAAYERMGYERCGVSLTKVVSR